MLSGHVKQSEIKTMINPRAFAHFFLFSPTTMNLVKKFLAGAASVAVFCTSSLVSVSVANASNSFSDIVGHWSESYVNELADAGIISTNNADGSPKSSYYPDNSLTRAELTKLAIEAFYGDSVSDLADAFADTTAPSFTDVATSEWYFKYVEIAKGLEIVQGVGGGQFAPTAPITRSAALKVILLTGDIEDSLDPASPFTDVASSDWFYSYVATAYNDCIVNGTSATTFSPNGNVTRGEVAKILSNAIKVSDGQDICNAEEPTDPTDPTDPVDPEEPITYDGTLEVSLSADSPDAQSVPKNGSNIPFLAIDLTNTGNDDVEVKGLVIAHGGLGNESDIDTVKIFDGIVQRGSDRGFTSDEEIAPLNLSNDPIVVEAGTTKTIVVAADTATTSAAGEHNMSILAPSDMTVIAADSGADVEVAGDFPIRGATMRVADVNVGTLAFDIQSTVADTDLEVGQTDQEFAKIKVTAGNNEDTLLQALTLDMNGADDGDLANLYLEFNGQRISEIVDFVKNEKVTFDLTNNDDEGWVIAKGKNLTMRVKADVISGVSNTVQVYFDSVKSDVIAHGLVYGFGVGLCDQAAGFVGGACTGVQTKGPLVNLVGGDITFAFNSSARDVAADTDNVEFGVLTLSNMGESVDLKKGLKISLTTSANVPAGATAGTASFIRNIRLVDVATGKTFVGPEDMGVDTDATVAGAYVATFNDEQTLETGDVLNLSVQGDIDANLASGTTMVFTLDMSSVTVKGIESNKTSTISAGEHDIRPKSNISTKTYTIANPSVTFTSKTLNSDFYVRSAKGAVVWKGSVRSNNVQDVNIRSMRFEQTVLNATFPPDVGASKDDIVGFSLYKKEGNVMTPIETNRSFNSTKYVSFSSLDEDGGASGLMVPAGDEFEIVLVADISSEATSNRQINMVLNTAQVSAEDETGNNATVANGGANVPLAGTTFTLQANGTLTASLDADKTPDAAIVIAGQQNVPLSVFKLKSQYEEINVEDLTVTVVGVDTTAVYTDVLSDVDAIDSVSLYYYDDGTPVKKTTGQAASVSTLNSSAGAFFQGLDLVTPIVSDLYLEARVSLRNIDSNDANATAKSGMAIAGILDLSVSNSIVAGTAKIRGVDSGVLLGAASINAAALNDEVTTQGDTLYVFNNKVIAEKSSNQDTSLGGGTEEALKLTLTPTGDNNAYLEELTVNVSVAGTTTTLSTAAADAILEVDGTQVAIASAAVTAGNGSQTIVFTPAAKVSLKTGGSVAVVKFANVNAGTGDTASIATEVKINGSTPGADGIKWSDYGTNGTDGVAIKWIDLGSSDASTTILSNTLKK